MKKKSLFIFTTILLSFTSWGQNLVPNPSFEEYHLCPDTNSMTHYSTGWYVMSPTPDYFNSCATFNWFSVPHNIVGYQEPYDSGNAYGGCIIYAKDTENIIFNYREYFGIKLIDSLIIGQTYYINLKVSLANHSNCASNKLGVLFLTNFEYNDLYYPITPQNFAHIYSDSIFTDTLKWTTLSGVFIADSTYNYVVFGNFFDDNHTDTIRLGEVSTIFNFTPSYFCYYYIDNICISSVPNYCDSYIYTQNPPIIEEEISIYPNPVNKDLFIQIPEIYKRIKIIIYNAYGKTIKEKNLQSESSSIDVSNLSPGIYFIQILTEQKNYIKQIIIN
ncbi:MAG TPA: T9SS type A sorting domain-containing protein [Bacteroidales bacterium]|nr:T9SS type A sorting domain-containing protein [Bacteroidales bacterium]HQB20995.1 T9SS type A sorting domain-containing protein [Bacteroidales bacterium]